jgi:hypothetical protein
VIELIHYSGILAAAGLRPPVQAIIPCHDQPGPRSPPFGADTHERELTLADRACLLANRNIDHSRTEEAMRTAIWALLLCSAASTSAVTPAAAQNYPFCIKGCDFGAGRGDCIFSSYQQCQATASGRDATCDANPYYSANAEPQPNRSRQSRRRF